MHTYSSYRSTWDEIQDVFGDGHDYDWALQDDEEDGLVDDMQKVEMKYQDVCRFSLVHPWLLFSLYLN